MLKEPGAGPGMNVLHVLQTMAHPKTRRHLPIRALTTSVFRTQSRQDASILHRLTTSLFRAAHGDDQFLYVTACYEPAAIRLTNAEANDRIEIESAHAEFPSAGAFSGVLGNATGLTRVQAFFLVG